MISLPRPPAGASLLRYVPRQGWPSTLFRVLLPSFIADVVYPEHKPRHRLHPTSYLDGLRGVASFIVFICHYTVNNWHDLVLYYGIHPQQKYIWLQAPYFRLIYCGRPMVQIFFVISGFVLSYKPLKCIHARDLDKCYTTLSSSTFRRAFRLFVPCIVSTFIIAIACQMGMLGSVKPWGERLRHWSGVVFHEITWGWEWDKDMRPKYDIHLWTIPIEFAHSMLLFMVILMTARMRRVLRQATVFGLMMYCLQCGKWAAFEFLTGMWLAEFHVVKSAKAAAIAAAEAKEWEGSSSPISETEIGSLLGYPGAVQKHHITKAKSTIASFWRVAKPTLHVFIMVVGLFICGWPANEPEKAPGIKWFYHNTPEPFFSMGLHQKFWFSMTALGIVWTVGEVGFLRRLFEGPVAQYSGRISYAIYICHGPVLDTYQGSVLGRTAKAAVGEPGAQGYQPAVPGWGVRGFTGTATLGQQIWGCFIGFLLLGPLVVWLSDLFWRGVDNQVVKIARQIENACLDDFDEQPKPRGHQGYAPAA